MKSIFIIPVLLISVLANAQTREEILEEFRQERQAMMSEILEMFQSKSMGRGFFDDDMDPFDNIERLRRSSDVLVDEKHEDDGTISILITPKSEKIELDIQTKHNMITIKSESRVEEASTNGGNSFKNISSSSYSQSISIPQGYIAEKPIPEGKGLKIILRPAGQERKIVTKKKEPKTKEGISSEQREPLLTPIGKTPGEEVI